MSASNKKCFYADKKSAIVAAIIVAAWMSGGAKTAFAFSNRGGSAFRNDSRPLFSYPSRSAFGSYPRTYEPVSRRYPERNDEQTPQIIHESSTTVHTPVTNRPVMIVSGAGKPMEQDNSESKPSYPATQTIPLKPAQPEVPSAAGQHENIDKDVAKPKHAVAEPSAITEALKQYRGFEWGRAASLLRESLEQGMPSVSEKLDAYVLLGAMAYQLGHADEAIAYFTKAHELNPSAIPSGELFPPQVVGFYKSVNRIGG